MRKLKLKELHSGGCSQALLRSHLNDSKKANKQKAKTAQGNTEDLPVKGEEATVNTARISDPLQPGGTSPVTT